MGLFKSLFGSSDVISIDAAEASKRLNSGTPPYIVDVREKEEFSGGHLLDAHLIPVNQLGRRMGDIPKAREILVVCASGSRSMMAAQMLISAGYQVMNLRGGMTAWVSAGLPIQR